MVLKACAYKDCENYILDGVSSGDFTLFKFPKDERRKKQWMDSGCVPQNLPATSLFMCSDHFDKKYISINNRRKLLVGPAIPVPCTPDTNDGNTTKKDLERVVRTSHDNYVIINETDIDKADYNNLDCDDELLKVESTTKPSDEEVTLSDIVQLDMEDISANAQCSSSSKKKWSIKRKRVHEINLETKEMCKKTVTTTEVEKNHSDSEEMDENNLIDSSQVATFIFKGEVYVQMPKKHYLQEKRYLLSELLLFKSVINDIKLKLDVLKGLST